MNPKENHATLEIPPGSATPESRKGAGKIPGFVLFFTFFLLSLLWTWEQSWPREHLRMDSRSFYFAGKAWGEGVSPYSPEALQAIASSTGITKQVFAYLYPPVLAQMLAIPSRLAAVDFDLLWTFLSIFCMAGICVMLVSLPRTFRDEDPDIFFRIGAVALLIFLLPFRNNLLIGQANLLVLLGITGCWAGYRSGKDLQAGFWLAWATVLKVTPGFLVLFFFARGRRRLVVGWVSFLAGMVVLSLIIGGSGPWKDFLALLQGQRPAFPVAGLGDPVDSGNLGISGFLLRILLDRTWVGPAFGAWVIGIAVGLLLLLGRRSDPDSADRFWGPFLWGMVMISPLVWFHHLVFLLPGLFELLIDLRSRGKTALFLGTILLVAALGIDFPGWYPAAGIFDSSPRWGTNLHFYLLSGLLFLELVWCWKADGKLAFKTEGSKSVG